MKFDCSLVTRHSEKKDRDYQVFVIKITKDYEITFFPKTEQLKLINVLTKANELPSFFSDEEVSSLKD